MNKAALLLLIASAVSAAPASAQLFDSTDFHSPMNHELMLKFGPYHPDIDSEGGGAYKKVFDDSSIFMFRAEYDYQFWRGVGSLAVAFEVGYGSVSGFGIDANSGGGAATSDTTSLGMVPFSMGLGYNFDYLATRWSVPLVPYAKIGLDYVLWWVNDGVGDTSKATNVSGTDFTGAGDTFGWHATVGLKLLLDVFAPKTAQTFDNEVGVNNSYLFAELFYADIDDFGSDRSWQLGTLTGMFGIAFEF